MSETFTRAFAVRWADLDFNGHMRNTAYLDVAADVRMMYFQSGGFSMREFDRVRFGPVILRDELEYFDELRLRDEFQVKLEMAGMSEDGKRFIFRNDFSRPDGMRIARISSGGGWLNLDSRRLAAPPTELLAIMKAIHRTDDFKQF